MKTFAKILAVFLIWRVALFLIGYFANGVLLYDPSFPYADGLLDLFNLPQWLYSWGGFDGVHYISIARYGYKFINLIQAFFPVYPLLIKFVSIFTQNILISGLLISNISFVALLVVWYKFLKESGTFLDTKFNNSKIAWLGLLILILFPTSFFFVAIYTESFFLLFVLLSFIFTQKKKYFLAAVCVAVASATKVVGIALVPALIFEIIFSDIKITHYLNSISGLKLIKNQIILKLKNFKHYLKPSIIISLGSIGLLSYMIYLYKEFNDPLYFFHVQSEFGGIRQETIITYPQVLYRYIKILLTARPFNLKYFSYAQDLVASTLGLGVILYSAKKVKLSYVIFSLLAFILPTLTGTFSSMPRYILVCFPLFIMIALWAEKSKIFRYTWFTVSILLLILNTVLFIQGYWVA